MMVTTNDLLSLVTELRCSLHQIPEVGHEEWRTADLIEKSLKEIGLRPFRPADTSIAVTVGPPGRTPRIGFRADVDALQILEANDVPYRSQTPGLMHACGHDGHAAALVGLAIALQGMDLEEPALLVFQQAEESYPSGASIVLDALPSNLIPSEFVSFHLWPQLPENVVGIRSGPLLAAVAGVEITITGRPGKRHGTNCDEGAADALAAGLELYRRLRSQFPSGRRFPAGTASALSIGMVQAGEAPNVVAMRCSLSGTLRALSWEDEIKAVATIRAIASDVSAESATIIEVRVVSGIRPPVSNDPELTRRIEDACQRLGIAHRFYPDEPVGVSDDFGWYVDGRPGALVFVGCGASDSHPDLHDPCFDFREHVLLIPIRIGTELVRRASIQPQT